jgi:hypothetical protein
MRLFINYNRLRLTNERPDLLSERAPQRDKTATVGEEVISGHKSQNRLDTETY